MFWWYLSLLLGPFCQRSLGTFSPYFTTSVSRVRFPSRPTAQCSSPIPRCLLTGFNVLPLSADTVQAFWHLWCHTRLSRNENMYKTVSLPEIDFSSVVDYCEFQLNFIPLFLLGWNNPFWSREDSLYFCMLGAVPYSRGEQKPLSCPYIELKLFWRRITFQKCV